MGEASSSKPSSTPSAATKGMILGPDGKPCKPCMAFRDWSKSKSSKSSTTSSSLPLARNTRENCPADVESLGRATWTFLHTAAAYYPPTPSAQHQRQMLSLLQSLPSLYPCHVCADHLGEVMKLNPPDRDVKTREGVMRWLCERHNEVNIRLGKDEFECSTNRLDERWKDGPKDGSCD